MEFSFHHSLDILKNTPHVLHALLNGLSDDWLYCNEGPDTWTAFDVVGHLIECEETNFIIRAGIILSVGESKPFETINMTAQFERNRGKHIQELLKEFTELRQKNVDMLNSMQISESDLRKTGIHPRSGKVKLSEVLATWVAHDLSHIVQISRIMAKQYTHAVGPFYEYLRILK